MNNNKLALGGNTLFIIAAMSQFSENPSFITIACLIIILDLLAIIFS